MKSRVEATALDEVKYPCLGNKKIDSCGAPLSKNISRYKHSFSTKIENPMDFSKAYRTFISYGFNCFSALKSVPIDINSHYSKGFTKIPGTIIDIIDVTSNLNTNIMTYLKSTFQSIC